MELKQENTHAIGRLRSRLKRTGDSEPEQAIIRLVIGFLLIGYFCIPWEQGKSFIDAVTSPPSIMVLAFYSIALAIFLAITINPTASPIRRVTGTLVDLTSLSILMFHSGAESIPFFFIYLWVILGNGFRYGVKYIYISHGIGIAGFSVVVFGGPYWQENPAFGSSLFMMLCLLPLYAAFLLKKLHAAVDMAKQASEAKSRFLANMSHELRTPLNGVIGMGELLRETNLNYEQRELVGSMHTSANTLLKLIENILDISKIEAGKVLIESKDLDLHSLVTSVIYMLAPLGDNKGLKVSCNFAPETPFALKGDQQHIHQVLVNLVSNAIKFTEKGSVTLSVSLAGGNEAEPVIRFEIADTGIGISDQAIDSIFENFTQADASTSRSYGGTGLGTAISKELVSLMGGNIGVESVEHEGSKFWFEIPFIKSTSGQTSIDENRTLLLATKSTAAIIKPSLVSWDIDFRWIQTSARALTEMLKASDQGVPYETIVVDQDSLVDINATQFAKMIKSEESLDSTSLVLINSSDTMVDANITNQYYISTIDSPEEKRLLFNSLHAAQSVKVDDSKITTMADHYAKQVGAKSLNILVAEDNEINQKVINGILQKSGHQVRIVSTGNQALDILSSELEGIDMLILDMNMPEISGIEVVKFLRVMDTSGKMPVIMLTADATPAAREASINAGANRFLTKPIDARLLLESIAALSKNVRSRSVDKEADTAMEASLQTDSALISEERSQWYDGEMLKELETLGDSPGFVKTLLTHFIADGTRHLINIKSAIDDDYPEYRENLHALKGSAAEFGARQLVDICLKGESIKPYDIGTDTIKELESELEIIFNNTIEALNVAVNEADNIATSGPAKATNSKA